MKKPVLPLHQLQAFHAAARHLSFSRAAQELNVLGPAIGRQVALLEEDLAVRLFLRTKPRLTLTEEGTFLARAVAEGFDTLQEGLMQLRQRRLPAPIVVNASIGFTSFYLLPRMADFQESHPDIEVQIVTRDQDPEYDPTDCDLVVTFGRAGLSGSPSGMIIPERLVAVCTPSLLAETGPMPREALCRKRL
ncbi:MAG: LysR family transcriptional regulator, partial [Pseudomonadota bacterium]